MKKLIFAFALGTLFAVTGCSGGGAFSEKEKDTQDVADSIRQESGFEALEQAANSDSTAATDSTAPKQ